MCVPIYAFVYELNGRYCYHCFAMLLPLGSYTYAVEGSSQFGARISKKMPIHTKQYTHGHDIDNQ